MNSVAELRQFLKAAFPDAPISLLECNELLQVIMICERRGYGNVMQVLSMAWRRKDPMGALSVGPCYGQLEKTK